MARSTYYRRSMTMTNRSLKMLLNRLRVEILLQEALPKPRRDHGRLVQLYGQRFLAKKGDAHNPVWQRITKELV